MKITILSLAFIAGTASKNNPIQEFDQSLHQAAVKSQITTCQKVSHSQFDRCIMETKTVANEYISDFRKITFQELEKAAKNQKFIELWNNAADDEKEELSRILTKDIQDKFKQLEVSKHAPSPAGLDKRFWRIFKFGRRTPHGPPQGQNARTVHTIPDEGPRVEFRSSDELRASSNSAVRLGFADYLSAVLQLFTAILTISIGGLIIYIVSLAGRAGN
jgi:hypothetical protein